MKVTHLAKARCANEITAAALYVLQQSAYKDYTATVTSTSEASLEFREWCCKMGSIQSQFFFWSQVLELEILILEIVRSIREGHFKSYAESVTALLPCLDHINYTRWLSVFKLCMA